MTALFWQLIYSTVTRLNLEQFLVSVKFLDWQECYFEFTKKAARTARMGLVLVFVVTFVS